MPQNVEVAKIRQFPDIPNVVQYNEFNRKTKEISSHDMQDQRMQLLEHRLTESPENDFYKTNIKLGAALPQVRNTLQKQMHLCANDL